MGETERKTRKRNGYAYAVKYLLGLCAVIILCSFYVIPRFPAAFSQFRDYRAQLSELRKEKSQAEERQAELAQQQTELAEMGDRTKKLQEEVFGLAAQLEKQITDGSSSAKICYITIDDGPYYRGNRLLDIFRKYDVKATFFLTTANGNILPDKGELSAASMYPKYIKEGHTIGNHSYSHQYSSGGIYSSADAFMKDVEKQDEFISSNTGGYNSGIVRFPGGESAAGDKAADICTALRKKGYGWAGWTVDTGDSGSHKNSPSDIVKTVKTAAAKQNIMVVLCHEWSENTEKALPEMIEYLQGQGYIMLPLFRDSIMVSK